MAGTATADPDIMCGGVIKNEYKTQLQAKNGLQWVKVDGDTVTLHNIGINNGGWDSNPNSGIPDYYYFTGVDASEKSIIIDWQDDSNPGDILPLSPVRSNLEGNSPGAISIKAKDLTISANFVSTSTNSEQRRYNNKGLVVEQKGVVTVDVSGKINLETGEFPIYATTGKIEIINFTDLVAKDTGLQEKAGDVIRNVGEPSSVWIEGGKPDSTITLVSEKSNYPHGRTLPVVQDASSQGITIRGGTISITREAEQPHSIVLTGYYAKEGHIDIEGGHAVIIGKPEHKNEFAVQGFSQGDGFSSININQNPNFKGKVTIHGRTTAESAEVNIDYAGEGSLQNGDVLAAKSHQGSKDRFTEGDELLYGGPGTKTGVMNLVFSGAGAGMKGNMTAEEGSSITADFSGDNAFFNGNITAQKGERFTEGEKSSVTVNASRNAKLTGNVSVEDGGMSNVNLSGESLWTGKSALSGTEAASNVSVNDNSTWKVTADSAVSTLKLSGGTVDLEGGAHQIKIGHLSADGTPGTFRMDMTYHDNQLSTYENAEDSDFLYVGGGEGQTFRVEAADNSSLNSMKDGDKLCISPEPPAAPPSLTSIIKC